MPRRRCSLFVVVSLLSAIALSFVMASTLFPVSHRSATRSASLGDGSDTILRAVRHASYKQGKRVSTIEADTILSRRPKLGIFRLGFARELVLRNGQFEILLDDDGLGAALRSSLQELLPGLREGGSKKGAKLTGIRTYDFKLRAVSGDGRWVELSPRSGHVGITSRGALWMTDGVTVRTNRDSFAFETLKLDSRSRGFVAATLPIGDRPASNMDVNQALLELNASTAWMFGR